jgi:hypothetical protein
MGVSILGNFKDVLKENPDVWKNESALLNYIRGGLRRGLWEKSPVKLKFIKNNRRRIPNPNPRGRVSEVWGGECNVCKLLHIQTALQVDHIRNDFNKLSSMDGIQEYIENLVLVTVSDLQLVCKPCHGIISHSQRKGISFEEALLAKEVIAICKSDDKVVAKLLELGIIDKDIPKYKKGRNELVSKLMRGI